jgi:membrane protease YdiL (CAAX protease family)
MSMNLEHKEADARDIGARESLVDLLAVFAVSGAALLLERTAHHLGWVDIPESAKGVSAVIAGCLTAVAMILLRKQKLSAIGFRRPERWAVVPIWVIGIFLVFALAQIALPALIRTVVEIPAADLSRYDALYQNLSATIAMALLLPITASIPEEIIYRGFLLDRLVRICGDTKPGLSVAVAIQSLLFGAAHFQWGLGGMFLATTMGVIWGTSFLLVKRNLWIVIMAHSLGHVALVTQLYFVKASAMG